ncbi:hypothetical protein H2203_003776 [Taxawa tesnikishii (nom. ined.)]|nr:hypothetical protein H2203_003776 [Dothideales sp. JES 119]
MPALDPTVAAVLDRNPTTTDSDDEDALISALEEDDSSLNAFREQRLQQLHSEFTRAKAQRNSDYGTYIVVKDEKAVMDITTSARFCVVHFMKPDFNRCRIMDQKLEALAPKHFDTRFLAIDVENAPFLVNKLKIQVLPCVICFMDGVGKDRILGFEGLGRKPDSFTLQELEARLLQSGVLVRAKMIDEDEARARDARERKKREQERDDDDDDWD